MGNNTIRGINSLELRIHIELDIWGWAAYSANITHIKTTERTAVIYQNIFIYAFHLFFLGIVGTLIYTTKCVVCTY